MKIVIEEHYVPEKRYTTTKYIASDGKEFSTEDSCLRHEEQLEVSKHPVFKNCITNVSTFDDEYCGSLYYIRDKNDYDFLINHNGISKRDKIYSDFEQYGEGWYLFWSEGGGDYYDVYNIYNYKVYVKELEDDLKQWQENIQIRIETRGIYEE